jgi:hypothetical protein
MREERVPVKVTETTGNIGEASSGPAADFAELMDMLIGLARAQVLNGVAALHIPDHLAGGASTPEEVAEREGSQVRATYRLMRAAAALGVLSYEGTAGSALPARASCCATACPVPSALSC